MGINQPQLETEKPTQQDILDQIACRRKGSFIATRHHHFLEIAEDYVEMIADLIEVKGEARTCDIAKVLGVSHVTVVRTIQRLTKKGLVYAKQHKPIMLTEEGKQLALFCKQRHNFLLDYLIAIGVPEEVAMVDIEGMEHHISATTLEALRRQLELGLHGSSM